MANYKLGDYSFVTSNARDELAALRLRYADLGAELGSDFGKRFNSLSSADELFARYPTELDKAFRQTTTSVAKDVAAERIYHWDETALRKQLEERSRHALEKFEKIHDEYLSIIMTAEERENLRADADQSRPSIMGGGFGVEGAAKGIAAATAVNVAIGLVHGAANAVGKAVATGGDKRRKEALFQASATRDGLAEVLRDVALEGHKLVADTVNAERQDAKFEPVTDVAAQRANALTSNVAAGRVPGEEVAAVLAEALRLDPFLDEGWRLWIEHVGDEDGSVERTATALGVRGLAQHKQSLIERKRAGLSWSTPEECRLNSEPLAAQARFYGLPADTLQQEIEARAVALDERRRTFAGTVYDTIEAMETAKAEAAAIARRTVGDVIHDTEAAADQARDAQTRTVNGRVYESNNDAEIARRRFFRPKSIFYWISIVLVPFPSAFMTLLKGFGAIQRVFAFVWMVAYSAFFVYNGDVIMVFVLAVVATLISGLFIVLGEAEFTIRKGLWARLQSRYGPSPLKGVSPAD